MENLEVLKKEIQNNENSSSSQKILKYLKNYADKISKEKGLILSVKNENISTRANGNLIDFQIECSIVGNYYQEFGFSNLSIDLDNKDERIYVDYENVNYNSSENLTFFNLYTTVEKTKEVDASQKIILNKAFKV